MIRALRAEARIFLLQFLCALMVLQGEPLWALERMVAETAAAGPQEDAAETDLSEPENPPQVGLGAAELPGATEPIAAAESAAVEAAAPAELERRPSSSRPAPVAIGSVTGAFGRLLAAAGFATLPVSELPPSPPTRRAFALPIGGPPTPFRQRENLDAIPLYTGWNLISLPQDPADPSPAAIFQPVTGQIAEAFTYDLCDTADPRKRYAPGDAAGSDMTSLDTKRGVWVESASQVLLPISGTLPATTAIPLCPGWNLIGFPAGQSRQPRTVLAPIAGKYLRLYGYDAGKPQPWAVFDPNVPEWASDLNEMIPENRLKKVTLASGMTVEHIYDVDGTRVKTVTTPAGGPAQVVEYLVDTSGGLSQMVLEGSSTTNISAYYLRGDDLISVIRPQAEGPSVVREYHADGLGSIRALTDETGTVTDTWQFEAFGAVVAHSGSDVNAYLFAGEMMDPNKGWAYHRARWMDPKVGRFGAIDLFEGILRDPSCGLMAIVV